jgi:hypothetical protein
MNRVADYSDGEVFYCYLSFDRRIASLAREKTNKKENP